ncbi:MAG: ferrochelatase [Pseudomonadales bacterium]
MTAQIGVLLVNLGSPEQATPKAVAKFLKQFLGDSRVVEIPRLVWLPLLYAVIAPLRSKRSAKKYQQIWWPEGSPLKVISEQQASGLQSLLGDSYLVHLAYTYGQPAISSQLDAFTAAGIERVVLLPLYPQYSGTTTGAILDQLANYLQSHRVAPQVNYIRDYYNHPAFITALAASVREHWQANTRSEKLLMSFHGIPERCVEKGDPYQAHCEATANALAVELQLSEDQWAISYQSRLGPAQWLQPATSDTLQSWGKQKLASVDIICPAFSVDCLETLEEIKLENRAEFQTAGGGAYHYIDCLNARPDHLAMMADLIKG